MSGIELVLIAIGLAMDAFAVSVCKGLGMHTINTRVAFVLALFFGGFQALMPLIGYLLGSQFLAFIEPIDHWIAFGLLGIIGAKMIWDAFHEEDEDPGTVDRINIPEFFMLAVATSIDALAVGISLAALKVNIGISIAVIGIITFFLTLVGVVVGNRFGTAYEQKAQIIGGVVLIGIGCKILLEHLGFF